MNLDTTINVTPPSDAIAGGSGCGQHEFPMEMGLAKLLSRYL